MCRIAAYLGPAAPLSTLLYDAPRSLEVQSYEPREQLAGKVNVDGTGIAWWNAAEAEPLRYVTERPPWSDANLPALSRRLQAAAQLAVVRSATPGLSFGASSTPPFVHGRFAFAHNGAVEGFRESLLRPMIERIPDALLSSLGAISDTHAIFLDVVRRMLEAPGAGLPDALGESALETSALCARLERKAVLNLVACDGERVVACRLAQGTLAPTIYTLTTSRRWPSGAVLASEPLDDDAGWTLIPDRHLVVLTTTQVTLRPLDS